MSGCVWGLYVFGVSGDAWKCLDVFGVVRGCLDVSGGCQGGVWKCLGVVWGVAGCQLLSSGPLRFVILQPHAGAKLLPACECYNSTLMLVQ